MLAALARHIDDANDSLLAKTGRSRGSIPGIGNDMLAPSVLIGANLISGFRRGASDSGLTERKFAIPLSERLDIAERIG